MWTEYIDSQGNGTGEWSISVNFGINLDEITGLVDYTPEQIMAVFDGDAFMELLQELWGSLSEDSQLLNDNGCWGSLETDN